MKDNDAMRRLVGDEDWAGLQQCLANREWDPNRPLVLSLQEDKLLLLPFAAGRGHVALTKQLIELGVQVNARVRGEDTALMSACEIGHREIVDLLLQAGADVNTKSTLSDEGDRGETPLMAAAQHGYREIIENLLQKGASVSTTTRRGRTALTYALLRGDIDRDLVRLLLEAGCPVDGRDLHHPVYQRDLDVVKLLLTAKPDVNRPFDWPTWVLSNERGDTPLFVAVAKNSAEILGPEMGQVIKPAERLAIIDLLIEAGADVNAQRGTKGNGWTPLMLAAAVDEDEVARRLLDAGADPNKTVKCSRITLIDGRQKQVKGPLNAVGMAQERPDNKKIRRLLLGHE